MRMWNQISNFLNIGRYEFFDILSFNRGRRCSGLTRYGILYDIIFSLYLAAVQRPWRSLDFLSALVSIISANNAEIMWSFCRSVCHSWQEWVSGDPLEVTNFWQWTGSACGLDSGSLFHFLHHCGIEDFCTFVSISYTINGRFVPYLAKWLTPKR